MLLLVKQHEVSGYSPQNMINDDIISHLGYLDLNSYIGDPTEIGDTQYNSLVKFSNIYLINAL